MCVKLEACPSLRSDFSDEQAGVFHRKTGHFSVGCLSAELWRGVGGLGSGGSSVCMSPLRTTSLVGEVGKEVTRYKFPVKSSFWGCHIQHGTSS